ncbi:hypothetical protein I7X12_06710 [Halosimplex litoreum]|uniref:DUF4282 domain-containing protein n=1 Tax=Halosimplex litoreum TaxID=1198301 RepID=A0A7T3G0U4_9EURY|nr:hypothetical protein [Halosimplex litoreum]QPV64300.1 hypothetical protein I7X12_06710 [Halosimplex litoreum]
MSGWSPPSLSRELVAAFGAAYLLVIAYALLIQGAILLGLLPGILLVGAYLLWRIMGAVEAIADGIQRIAEQLERE